MDEARLAVLRQQRDEIKSAAAKKEAEKKRRLANAKAKGRAAGDEWVMSVVRYERMKQLSDGSPDVIEAEVWHRMKSDEVVTEQEWRERTTAPVPQAYLAAFTEAVEEMLRKVDEG